ncbi:hypothetical protein ACIBP4_00095 [Micromonospora maritima]|uniref:Uncharacterized protein n=1 Tax=Micromonospora maritima TaxID=986711 RepID=A0ABW7ZEP2_9ACTN
MGAPYAGDSAAVGRMPVLAEGVKQMPFHLMTVEKTHRFGPTMQLLPRIPVKDLLERAGNLVVPMAGDLLQLRLPDGRTVRASVYTFGIEMWEVDGSLLTNSDPADPELTLTVQGDSLPDEIPMGTEVWLAEPRYQD